MNNYIGDTLGMSPVHDNPWTNDEYQRVRRSAHDWRRVLLKKWDEGTYSISIDADVDFPLKNLWCGFENKLSLTGCPSEIALALAKIGKDWVEGDEPFHVCLRRCSEYLLAVKVTA
jgi:hypothetical protein